jgi:hypothetical protein
MGDRGSGTASGADGLRVEPDHQPEHAQRAEERGDELPRNRRLQDSDARKLGGAGTDLVHLHMIAVTVAATRVIAQQHVGLLFANKIGEPPGGFTEVRAREPHSIWRVWIEHGPVTAVGIPQMNYPGDAQRRCTRPQLVQPDVSSLIGRGTHVTVTGHGNDHAVAFSGQPG